MDWVQIIKDTMESSGLLDQVKKLAEENRDEIDNIEEYVTNMIVQMMAGDDDGAYKDFKKLKKPSEKLKASRFFIGRAREERKKYEKFKASVVTVAGGILGTAIKGLL